nr:tetraspanin [Hymenolepis microstoma]CUU97506.1 tetraspanin [Hymenolepis microstoma]
MISEEETHKPNKCLRIANIMGLLFAIGVHVSELAIFCILENSGKYRGTNFFMVLIACLTSCLVLASVLGIVGAYLKNRKMLISFVSFLTIYLAAGLTIGIVLLTKPDVAFPYAKSFFQNYIAVANSNVEEASRTALMFSMRTLQQSLKCCGFEGPKDFESASISCCETNTNCEADELGGCKDRILAAVETLSQVIGCTELITMVIPIIVVVCTIILIKSLKRTHKVEVKNLKFTN